MCLSLLADDSQQPVHLLFNIKMPKTGTRKAFNRYFFVFDGLTEIGVVFFTLPKK